MNSRARMLIFTVLLVIGAMAIGCAPEAAAPDEGATSQSAEDGNASTPVAAEVETIVLKGQSHNAAGNVYDTHWVETCELITAASGGRLELKPFPGGAIVPATEEFDAVEKGILNFAVNSPTYWKTHFPAAGPFSYRTAGLSPAEHYGWVSAGEGSALLQELVQGRVHVIPGSGLLGTPEIFMCTNEPITGVSDLKGLKMRGSGDGAEVLSRLGASMVFFSSTEIYESMQRGVIDAFECSGPAFNWAYGMHEVAKYVYLSGVRQPCEYFPMFFNNDTWESLPDDLKVLVSEISKTGPTRCYYDMAWQDTIYVEKMEEYGNIVDFIPSDIEDAMVVAASEYYSEMSAKDHFYAKVIQSMDAYKAAIRGAFDRL